MWVLYEILSFLDEAQHNNAENASLLLAIDGNTVTVSCDCHELEIPVNRNLASANRKPSTPSF